MKNINCLHLNGKQDLFRELLLQALNFPAKLLSLRRSCSTFLHLASFTSICLALFHDINSYETMEGIAAKHTNKGANFKKTGNMNLQRKLSILLSS